MFVNYFESLEKFLLKSAKSAGAGRVKKGNSAKGGKAPSKHLADLIAGINGIIPSQLKAAPLRVMDKSGYSPEGADFIAYRETFRDLPVALGGCVPSALVHGIYYVCDALTRESLADVLGRAVQGHVEFVRREHDGFFLLAGQHFQKPDDLEPVGKVEM
ncbi:MAG: hypothetical protein HGB17_10085, partial [Syntrophobacteraceae bacterium]|nr:hypothetical protein [Syntrophobacteraceae bacterium]